MRIGIVTQPLQLNYGGIVQNYALQEVLRSLGHTPCTIDWEWPKTVYQTHELRRELFNLKTCLLHCIGKGHQRKLIKYKPSSKEFSVVSQNTARFINDYIVKTCPVNSESGFREQFEIGRFDALISGSDQVWRRQYNAFLPDMYLRFAEDCKVKRIAFSASFGTDEWEYSPQQTQESSRLAQLYDVITVRENSAVSLCREYLGVKSKQTLDPTLLLTKEDYISIVNKTGVSSSEGTLFHYILDSSVEKQEFVSNVSKQLGLIPFTAMPKYRRNEWTKHILRHRINDCVYPSVTQWIRGFMDADMVLVDSFHGVVFSIIFNKPFWAIGNSTRGMTRFLSLLELFGLEDRLLDENRLPSSLECKSINWDAVNSLLNKNREESIGILKTALQ